MRHSPQLEELLFTIRQHPAFGELRAAVACPAVTDFKESGDAAAQHAVYIFRSGRKLQHSAWLTLLTGEPSQQGRTNERSQD